MLRMKQVLAFLLILLNSNFIKAQDDQPSIYKMWSRGEGIKNFVFDIENDSIMFNFSEKDKWSASNIKSYNIVTFKNNNNDGRFVVRRDSLGIEHFRTIDFTALTLDSLKLYLHPEYFAEKEQAIAAPAKKVNEYKTFFTTEYLYLKKVEEKAPSLKKADYISFLKDAQVEAKKRAAAKTLNMDAKKQIDKRVEEFLVAYAKDKKYKGIIFPANLDKAMKAYTKDENVKKLMAGIKTNFVVKKGAEAENSKGPEAKKNSSKTDSKTDKKSTPKVSGANDLIIKTEEKGKK